MAVGNPGAIFYGRIPPTQRAYLLKLLKALRGSYDRLLVPCAGAFTVPDIALQAGWQPEQIEASDVSLYTTLVGASITGTAVESLEIQAHRLDAPLIDSPASALFALKLATLAARANKKPLLEYEEQFRYELTRRPSAHIAKLDAQLEAYRKKLAGISYRAVDLFEEIERVSDDPRTVIVCPAPFYSGDYDKLYDTGGFLEWAEPAFTFYDPADDYETLKKALIAHPGIAFWYWYKPEGDDLDRAVFAHQIDAGRVECLLASKPDEVRELVGVAASEKRQTPSVSANLPLWDESREINEDTRLDILRVSRAQATYYRDLFVHRMGNTSARNTIALLLDGHIFAITGINAVDFHQGEHLYVEETFGIAVTDRRHRLGRLLAQTLVCRPFLNMAGDYRRDREPDGIRGTVWTRYREDKASRGTFKLINREFDKPSGLNKLRYHGVAREVTLQETFTRWYDAELVYWKERST